MARGDVNHERISVPRVLALSQQHLTSVEHYESAWQTINTGFSPTASFHFESIDERLVFGPTAARLRASTGLGSTPTPFCFARVFARAGQAC
jgi:hypothetical protein